MPRLPDTFVTKRHDSMEDAWLKSGETYFRVGGTLTRMRTEFFDRHLLPPGASMAGPAVLFQMDSTTVLPPGWRLEVDEFSNLVISVEPGFQLPPQTADTTLSQKR